MQYQYINALAKSQGAFREAAIYATYDQLNLKEILQFPCKSEEVSVKLGLNPDTTRRFFYALVSIELLQESFGKFQAAKESPVYSNESSLTLFPRYVTKF